jgi:hypothetical protein
MAFFGKLLIPDPRASAGLFLDSISGFSAYSRRPENP